MTGGFQLDARFLFCRALPVTRDSGANPRKGSGNQGMPSLTLRALRFQLLLYRDEDPLE